ncbi:hypothetical protein [Neobacillus terrae]|uniref:hypothetical protein n=1 Tax=Neobacillus terrae TaxID=3034837 RepID=UPI00140AA302|nr:hypothetical protein [Neobacillus terrae]NHM31426.1 hypothetical protein [Neobacillus terrae]
MDNLQTFHFKMENDEGELVVKGEINGEAEIPFHDDLKFKAIIALLNSIDKKNFKDAGNIHIFDDYISEIEGTINELKAHEHFQGKNNQS